MQQREEQPVYGTLAGALARAQAAFPTIPRDREVTVTSRKTGTSYKFKYAPLDTILAAVRKPLSDNGLALSQLLDGPDLVTLLMHESGETLSGRMPLPPHEDVQGLGSAITYLRRYAIQALLGIAAEEDDDGNGAAGNKAKVTPRPPQSPRPLRPVAAVAESGPSEADIAALHRQWGATPDATTPVAPNEDPTAPFAPEELEGIAPTGSLTSAALYALAEENDIPKARLSVAAKTLFGVERWKITDLSDEERGQLWESLG